MDPFKDFKLGNVILPNRFLMAPVKTAFATTIGEVTYRHLAYYRRRAEGGVGAIIVEPMFIDSLGKEHPKQLGLSTYKHIEGLRKLTSVIHDHGVVAIAHLNHAGRAANPKATGKRPEAPSAVACSSTGAVPVEMTRERIEEIILEYAGAARRAVEAGFDIVELQFGLGYLIHQFISPSMNLRADEYGGIPGNRMRFGIRVLEAVRAAIGPDVAILTRISSSVTGDGTDLDDAVELAKSLESQGVRGLHVACGSICDSPAWYYQHMMLPAGKNLEWASTIKNEVSIPVIAVGRMGDPADIRDALNNEMVDAVALGRPLVADPDLPKKMAASQDEDVARCGACLQGCLVKVKSGEGLSCLINPEVGRETELFRKTDRPSKVIVIGGGPAGMQAALSAQKRGHRVTLYDDGDLGGKFKLATLAPGKEMMAHALAAMVRRTKKSQIALNPGRHVTAAEIMQEKPEHVILATGSKALVPNIDGLKEVLLSEDVLQGDQRIGHRVLIIGGGMVGLETAEFLAEKGHEVTVAEQLDDVAMDMDPITKKLVLQRLETHDVKVVVQVRLTRFVGGTAFISAGKSEVPLGEFDTIVAAIGAEPVNRLGQELRSRGLDVHVIGDAKKPAKIIDAVLDGFNVAQQI